MFDDMIYIYKDSKRLLISTCSDDFVRKKLNKIIKTIDEFYRPFFSIFPTGESSCRATSRRKSSSSRGKKSHSLWNAQRPAARNVRNASAQSRRTRYGSESTWWVSSRMGNWCQPGIMSPVCSKRSPNSAPRPRESTIPRRIWRVGSICPTTIESSSLTSWRNSRNLVSVMYLIPSLVNEIFPFLRLRVTYLSIQWRIYVFVFYRKFFIILLMFKAIFLEKIL